MKNVLVFRVVVLLVAALALSACNLFFSPEDDGVETPSLGDTGSLRLQFAESTDDFTTQAISEWDLAEKLNISYYQIIGKITGDDAPDDTDFDIEWSPGENGIFNRSGLIPGNWEITIYAYDNTESEDEVRPFRVGQADYEDATFQVDIQAGRTTVIEDPVRIVPLRGTGALNLALSWPAGEINAPRVELEVVDVPDGVSLPDGFNNSSIIEWVTNEAETGATLNIEAFPVGFFGAFIRVFGEDTEGLAGLVWESREFHFRIVSDRTTDAQAGLTSADLSSGGLELQLDPDMQDPFVVTLEGPDQFDVGESGTFMVNEPANNGEYTYLWYVAGRRWDDNGSSIEVSGGDGEEQVGVGTHRVSVFVRRNDSVLSSAGKDFTVTESNNEG